MILYESAHNNLTCSIYVYKVHPLSDRKQEHSSILIKVHPRSHAWSHADTRIGTCTYCSVRQVARTFFNPDTRSVLSLTHEAWLTHTLVALDIGVAAVAVRTEVLAGEVTGLPIDMYLIVITCWKVRTMWLETVTSDKVYGSQHFCCRNKNLLSKRQSNFSYKWHLIRQ